VHPVIRESEQGVRTRDEPEPKPGSRPPRTRDRNDDAPTSLGRGGGARRRRCGMRLRDRGIDQRDHRGRRRRDRDRRCAERRQLGRDDRALGAMTRAHRRLRCRIRLVIRTAAVRRIGAATRLHERDRPELRHRHCQPDEDRDHDGRDPGRGATGEHGIDSSTAGKVCQRPLAMVSMRPVLVTGRTWPGNPVRTTVRGSGRRARSSAADDAARRDRSPR